MPADSQACHSEGDARGIRAVEPMGDSSLMLGMADDHESNAESPSRTNSCIDLDCGIAHSRIETWLRDELALPTTGGGWLFEHESAMCHISIAPLEPRSLGTMALERCNLLASGDAAAVDAFGRLFTLRFMSAGG